MGRKINIADWVGIAGAHVLLLTPCIIFGVFIIPRFTIFLAIPFVFLVAVSLVSLNVVFLMDPGYIPLNSHPQAQQYGNQVQFASQSNLYQRTNQQTGMGDSEEQPVNLPEEYPFVQVGHYGQDRVISVDGRALDCKYCFTCQSIRPPRTYHCGSCDRCIYRHDHHCPWTGNCIGDRNYRFFFLFVINTSVLTWFVFICTLAEFIQLLSDPQYANINNIGNHLESILLLLFTFLMGIALLYLAVYHCYLVCKNLTTHEQIRGKYAFRLDAEHGGSGNPFDRGVWKNIKSLLFERSDPQLINFDFWAQESPTDS